MESRLNRQILCFHINPQPACHRPSTFPAIRRDWKHLAHMSALPHAKNRLPVVIRIPTTTITTEEIMDSAQTNVQHYPSTARVVGNAALTVIVLNVASRLFNAAIDRAERWNTRRRERKANRVVH